MEHRFEARAADVVGVNAAILLHNIAFWVNHNRVNNMHYHDGAYWTYNSNSAFRQQFTYMSRNCVEGAIKKLVEGGYILVGDYNVDRRDNTRWFTVTDAGFELDRNDECGEANAVSVDKPKAEKPKKTSKYANEIAEVVAYYNSVMNTNCRPGTKEYVSLITARLNEGYTVSDLKHVIDVKYEEWHDTDMERHIVMGTLFGNKFDRYLNQRSNAEKVSKYAAYD